ncbi:MULTISPECIES: DUF2231 domain-containing protein [Christiangramia]|uniref:Uncharacterized protein n=1 Tax=Christiangramia flava JLT2011 TaxID=1229726 RepID=A0A1L7I876_9FLAO|nr:DUF2231 domain-containing protein [Christiangramia flava]APU69790.1 hypothetical protein GRFL_3066 [Christiangramia flava JLT2011]MBT8295649.1 hypothetical protein [Christiangramia sp.]OSS39177.1 hypothetical protein C723_1723 [Christiangramia flava JLT2011]
MKKTVLIFFLMFLPILGGAQDDEHYHHNHEEDTIQQVDTIDLEKEVNASTKLENNQDKPVKANLDDFPNLHPLVVHFPIVLLLLGGILQLIQLFVLKRNLDWVILLCVGTGFIGAYIAGVYAHPHTHDLSEIAKKVLEQHDRYAEWTIYASALGAVLKLGSLFLLRENKIFEILVFLVLGFAAYSVSEAGHYGSQLVYIEGVGPQGEYLESEGHGH